MTPSFLEIASHPCQFALARNRALYRLESVRLSDRASLETDFQPVPGLDTEKNEAIALRQAQNLEDNENDPENRSGTVRLTIRIPPRRLCTLCSQAHAVLDLHSRRKPSKHLGSYADPT